MIFLEPGERWSYDVLPTGLWGTIHQVASADDPSGSSYEHRIWNSARPYKK